jgi:hypothetical protein
MSVPFRLSPSGIVMSGAITGNAHANMGAFWRARYNIVIAVVLEEG